MSNTMNLKSLLTQNNIVIPIIQRDYAQGRANASAIRVTFLEEIKSSLETGSNLTLDFVYGNETIDKNFQPLDGQQRLTTLWLLNWYISFKLGKLKDNKQWLSRFTYETRISSRDFINDLCNKMANVKTSDINEKTIADYIKKQTWFYTEWKQDPTIDALLRTLSGNFDGKNDNIESIFGNYEKKEYERLWKLLNDVQLVNFEELTINSNQLPISDDLYIKMNARGKQLTAFENFKADLLKHIRDDKTKTEEERTNISIKIDGIWTDVFWRECVINNEDFKTSSNPRVDESMFMFINRFLFNDICLGEISIDKNSGVVGKYSDLYNYLYGRDLQKVGRKKSVNNDALIEYENFDLYGRFISFDHIISLNTIIEKLRSNNDILRSVNTFFTSGFTGFNEDEDDESFDEEENASTREEYSFIPRYHKDENDGASFGIHKTELKERIYFLAICRYIEFSQSFNVDVFKQWMRIVKNLSENAQVENESTLIQVLKIINELAIKCNDNSWSVYDAVLNYDKDIGISILKNQLEEEKEKINKIKEDSSFETKLIDAENYSFFNGTIGFIYHDENGNINWNDFDTKLNKAKELFRENTIDTQTIKDFLSLFPDFTSVLNKFYFTNIGYHNRIPSWKKNILCDKDCQKQVHTILMGNIEESQKIADGNYKEFINSDILEKTFDSCKFVYQGGNYVHKAKGKQDESYIYIDDERIKKNKMIDGKTSIKERNSNYSNGFYFGTNTPFVYNEENYCLDNNNELCKCDVNWNILTKLDQSVEDFFDLQTPSAEKE